MTRWVGRVARWTAITIAAVLGVFTATYECAAAAYDRRIAEDDLTAPDYPYFGR